MTLLRDMIREQDVALMAQLRLSLPKQSAGPGDEEEDYPDDDPFDYSEPIQDN
jgi:hypothetical protein